MNNFKKFALGSALVILGVIALFNINSYFADQHHINWVFTMGGIVLIGLGIYSIYRAAK